MSSNKDVGGVNSGRRIWRTGNTKIISKCSRKGKSLVKWIDDEKATKV